MSREAGGLNAAIVRFLGAQAAAGPLALLGLEADGLSDGIIRAALLMRLDEVDKHADGASAEAEQVRRSLHAAAAQLLDPAVRSLILGLNRPRRPSAEPREPVVEQPSAISPEAIAETRLAIARFRGVNDASLARIASIASSAGVSVHELVNAAAARANAPAPPPPNAMGTANQPPFDSKAGRTPLDSAPILEELDPSTHTLRNASILAVVAIALISLAGGILWQISQSMRIPRASTPQSASADAPRATARPSEAEAPMFPTEKAGTVPPKAVPQPTDAVGLVRALAQCSETLSSDPSQAATQFEQCMSGLAEVWPSLSPDRLAAAQDGVVEFLYRSSRDPAIARRAAEAVSAPALAWKTLERPIGQSVVLPGVWSSGMLSRLARERELPAAAQRVFDSVTSVGAVGSGQGAGSFMVGATAAVFRAPSLLVAPSNDQKISAKIAPAAAWQKWVVAVDAISKDDAVLRDRVLLAGLDTVMTDGPEPSAGDDATKAISLLTGTVSWRAGSDSRTRLLSWFDQAPISSADLHAVTEHLALRSGAEGVDVSMVLPREADAPKRAELRERFATAWASADSPTRDALATEWAKLAKEAIDQKEVAVGSAATLAEAVVFSRLNDAAARIVSGDTQGAGDLLRKLDEPRKAVSSAASVQSDRPLEESGADGTWAIKYLAAEKNIPQRSMLLAELGKGSGAISRVNAEVLAADAVRGSPVSIRRQAQQVALKYSGSPAMVNALLVLAPSIPRTNESSDLVRSVAASKLPPLRDPEWRSAVRRALVERLLQLVAAQSDQGLADKLAAMLAESYAARAAGSSTATTADAVRPETPARPLALWWLRRCQSMTPTGKEPLTLDQIERRRAGRERLASGLVQSFAADQVWVCELFAFGTASERPGDIPKIAEIMDRLATSRRTVDHVFDQIRAAERAQTELWMLRLGEVAPPS